MIFFHIKFTPLRLLFQILLLKDLYFQPELKETLHIWDSQLASFGSKIIERRKLFVDQLNEIIYEIHLKLSGGREEIKIVYEPDVEMEEFERKLYHNQEKDIKLKQTTVGPHRDDFSFYVGDIDSDKVVVYDPFMGSGTTAVACKKLGMNCIGSELSSAQCEYANSRIGLVKAKDNSTYAKVSLF